MNRLFLVCLIFSFGFSLSAQNLEPVKWSFEVQETAEGYSLKAKAKIDKKWVVYSPFTDEGGPVPTSLSISDVITSGEIIEDGELIKEYSDLFEIDVSKFKDEVTFAQSFKPQANQKEITGYVRFMTCDGERCLAPKKIPFSISLN